MERFFLGHKSTCILGTDLEMSLKMHFDTYHMSGPEGMVLLGHMSIGRSY